MVEENMAIVKSLVSVAWADGVFADEEREMIEALISAFEADDEEAKSIRTYAEQKRTLEDIPLTDLSADDRRVLLQHAVLLTHVDGEQATRERQYIDELCTKLRIPKDEADGLIAAAEARVRRFLDKL